MKILILAAMDKELELLKSLLLNQMPKSESGVDYIEGNIGAHDVILAKCGIGKVNAALNTYRLVEALKPDLVINSGVAGGAGLPVGSVLVADAVTYSDVWCGPGTEYGEADGYPLFFKPSGKVLETLAVQDEGHKLHFGLIATRDKFISTAGQIADIRSHFPDVRAVDMESGAIAQTCALCGVPFAVIRVVSDTPGEGENISQYQNFWTEAPQKTFTVVRRLLANL